MIRSSNFLCLTGIGEEREKAMVWDSVERRVWKESKQNCVPWGKFQQWKQRWLKLKLLQFPEKQQQRETFSTEQK